jgi:hypothetical protein
MIKLVENRNTGTYNVPVCERTKLENDLMRKFQRYKECYQTINKRLYFKGREVFTMKKYKHLIQKGYRKSKGIRVRSLYHLLNTRYSGLSKRHVRDILKTMSEYQRSDVKFNKKHPLNMLPVIQFMIYCRST